MNSLPPLETCCAEQTGKNTLCTRKKTISAIKAVLVRHLQNPAVHKPSSVTGNWWISMANKTFTNFLQTYSKTGKIAKLSTIKSTVIKDYR